MRIDSTIADAYLNSEDMDKNADICGMICLARQWQRGSIRRLKELFYEGCRGFASKSAGI